MSVPHLMQLDQVEPAAVLRVPALLSVSTTARLLDVSPRTIRRRVADRSLPAVIDHGRLMIRADELRRYIDGLERVGARVQSHRRPGVRSYDFLREDAPGPAEPGTGASPSGGF